MKTKSKYFSLMVGP